MNIEAALAILDQTLPPGGLNNVQELVFRQAWQGQTYSETAQSFGYDPDYVKDVGSKLWQLLSEAFEEKVTKSNFLSVLRRHPLGAELTLASAPRGSAEGQPQQGVILQDTGVAPARHQNWGDSLDVSSFYGRTAELATLEQWIVCDRCRLVTLLGMGGVGKTALAVKLAETIQDKFDYLIWRSLRNAPPVAEVVTSLIQFLPGRATSLADTLDSKMSQLLERLREHRCLLILDNGESVLRSGSRAGHYREGYEGYGQLLRQASEASHQSCLVLTSREKPRGLAAKEGKSLPVRSFQLSGLSLEEGQEILKATGLCGSANARDVLIECYAGNPLALKIVSTTIQDLFQGEIVQFLEQGTLVFGDIRDLLDQQFKRLSDLERQVIHWVATEPEWVLRSGSRTAMPPISQWALLEALESLHRRSLIESNLVRFTQQPAIIEYITKQLIQTESYPQETAITQNPSQRQIAKFAQETPVDFIQKLISERLTTTNQKSNGNH